MTDANLMPTFMYKNCTLNPSAVDKGCTRHYLIVRVCATTTCFQFYLMTILGGPTHIHGANVYYQGRTEERKDDVKVQCIKAGG